MLYCNKAMFVHFSRSLSLGVIILQRVAQMICLGHLIQVLNEQHICVNNTTFDVESILSLPLGKTKMCFTKVGNNKQLNIVLPNHNHAIVPNYNGILAKFAEQLQQAQYLMLYCYYNVCNLTYFQPLSMALAQCQGIVARLASFVFSMLGHSIPFFPLVLGSTRARHVLAHDAGPLGSCFPMLKSMDDPLPFGGRRALCYHCIE